MKYIIWCPTSSLPPTKTFKTEEEAETVAKKMASHYPGDSFNVCKVLGSAKLTTVIYEKTK